MPIKRLSGAGIRRVRTASRGTVQSSEVVRAKARPQQTLKKLSTKRPIRPGQPIKPRRPDLPRKPLMTTPGFRSPTPGTPPRRTPIVPPRTRRMPITPRTKSPFVNPIIKSPRKPQVGDALLGKKRRRTVQ